jgi:hypothetical protein
MTPAMRKAKPVKRRPIDNYAIRRRYELQARRLAGAMPIERRPPQPVPACSQACRQARALLRIIKRAKPRPLLRPTQWTHAQDLALVLELAKGVSLPQVVRNLQPIRADVNRGAVDRRIRVLYDRYGRPELTP